MQVLTRTPTVANGTTGIPVVVEAMPFAANAQAGDVIGLVEPDAATATNEHVMVRVPLARRGQAVRGRFVGIEDLVHGMRFLGRVVGGPFYPDGPDCDVRVRVEVQGEFTGRLPSDTNDRPAPGSQVRALSPDRVGELLGCAGDMAIGVLTGWDAVPAGLQSQSKDVLPRNIGIFGTVGSGKTNTTQVLIEEASARGWAVLVIDVEGEYVEMDAPGDTQGLAAGLARFGRRPAGINDLRVLHPMSCASERADSRPFTLRLADFDTPVVTELIQATKPERNALMDCVEHFQNKLRTKAPTSEADWLLEMLNPSPLSPRLFSLHQLYDRARR